MNRKELISKIAEKNEMTKKDAEKALDVVLETISQALENGDKVKILGFGTFSVKERASKTGRNPKNGEEILIEARKVPVFKAGKELKQRVDQ